MSRHPDVPRPRTAANHGAAVTACGGMTEAGAVAAGQPAGRRPVTRLAAVGLTGVLAFGGLAACSTDEAEVVPRTEAGDTAALPAGDPVAATVAASSLTYESADVVVLGPVESAEAVAGMAGELGVPGLLGSVSEVADELERLGAETVVVPAGSGAGGDDATDADADDGGASGEENGGEDDGGADAAETGVETLEFDPEDLSVDGSQPQIAEPDTEAAATLLLDPAEAGTPAAVVARASVEAAAGSVVEVPAADPRATSDTVAAAQAAEGDGVLALGEGFGDAEVVESRMATARTAPELPGGGQLAFPGRRMIAAYGSPGVPSMGVLGEQDLDEAVGMVQELAAQYDDHTDVPAMPAMEIITTIASSEPGADGDYSSEVDPETLRPWIDRAAEEGIYVVLDLQPGTTHFLEQAKLYEDLLREPHVGLALDPEWRLEDGQQHLQQIGSVDAEEVNEVATWLADLTAENDLPQKVFILHQFAHSMISDREDVDASRDELAMVLHADGNGTPGMKTGTYDSLREDLPDGIRMAWKNFYDEDDPTFTPEQTMDVEPTPWFVSYQ